MDSLVMKAGGWLALAFLAVVMAAVAVDAPFAVHMGIVAVTCFAMMWVTVSRADYAGMARGLLKMRISADREEVCTRRVVGSREVTRTIPAAPAVEEYVVTEIVEDVEWDCEPIMAAREQVTA